MNRFVKIFLFGFLVSTPVFAAPPEVVLVFSANSEINRHLYSLVGNALAQAGGYKVSATLQPGSVTPGKYKAVIVFSTRATSGLEPSLDAFLKGYSAPAELYLVSLLSRSPQLTVSPLPKGVAPPGVDGVTAATEWSGSSQAMHGQWLHQLVTAIRAR